jgi:hypothetical protein
MVVRYDPGIDHDNNVFDLELVDYTTPNNNDPILGKLSSLLEWHVNDPVDDFEINRNDVIFGFQENRNPFIDHPNLVNFLWGENIGMNWNENLNLPENQPNQPRIYPNPTTGIINFSNNLENKIIEVFDFKGQFLQKVLIDNSNSLKLNLPSGIYFLRSSDQEGVLNFKIIVR